MRKEVEEALRSLTAEELEHARRYIEHLLAKLQGSGALARKLPEGAADRRQFERYALNLPATYFRHAVARERPGAVEAQDALVRDIARGGVRFFANEALAPGEVLTLYMPRALGVRKLFIEVRWAERRGGQFECGASFVGLDRVFAAQKVEEQRSEAAQMLLVCAPGPERDGLRGLLVKQGYSVNIANGVPEACAALETLPSAVVLARGPMLLAEDARLLKAVEARRGAALSIALVPTSELDDPANAPLRGCSDFIADPTHAQEVRPVVARTCRRLAAAQGRRQAP